MRGQIEKVINRQQTDSYMVSLKMELTTGSDPVHFRVAAYNAEDNEFDTLNRVQIGW
jgi:hypothetical protein